MVDVHVNIAKNYVWLAAHKQAETAFVCMCVPCACVPVLLPVRKCVCVCVCVHLFGMHAYNMCSVCIHLNLPVLISVCLCLSFLHTETEHTAIIRNHSGQQLWFI